MKGENKTKVKLKAVIKRFLITFNFLALLLIGVSFVLYKAHKTVLMDREIHNLEQQQTIINKTFKTIISDLKFIEKHHKLQTFLSNGSDDHLAGFISDLHSFSEAKGIYDQIRFLNNEGMEIIRINYNRAKAFIVPPEILQSKKKRYYFADTYKLNHGEIFMSPFDLNIEHGIIEKPLKPMIRFGTPVFDTLKQKKGVLILNYLGTDLLKNISLMALNTPGKIMLLNSRGYWLKGDRPDDEWGFMFKDKKNKIFKERFPAAWEKISKDNSGQFVNDEGMFTFGTVYPVLNGLKTSTGSEKAFGQSRSYLNAQECNWKIVIYLSPKIIGLSTQDFLYGLILIDLFLLALLGIVSWFWAMAKERQKDVEEELKKAHDKLEERVNERTIELLNVNEALNREVIEHKRTEERVTTSEERLRTIMDTVQAGIIMIEVKTRKIVNCNLAAAIMIGLSKKMIIGRICHEFICPCKKGRCPVCDLGQELNNTEHILLCHDGNRLPVIKTTTFIYLQQKKHIITSFFDITKMKESEAAKRELELQLQQAQKMEAIGSLAGGIAHDFNNILSAIIGYTELSIDLCDEEVNLQGNLKQVLKAGNRAKDLVQQILAFSRQTKQERKNVSINRITKEVLKLLKATLPTTIEIRENLTSRSSVLCDTTQIHQLLMNLCTNSAHAMKTKGGILEVSLTDEIVDAETAPEHPDLTPGSFIKLSVSDTGHGISPEIKKRVFDPFFTTKEQGEGTGMGLSVLQSIIKSNKGKVTVFSEPGEGATFNVYLPVNQPHDKKKSKNDESAPRGTERLLIVDDELSIVEMNKTTLERQGYHVEGMTNSADALERFRLSPNEFDLIITDMTMPNITGDQLAEKMHSIRPDISIILFTGFSLDLTEENMHTIGIQALLMKPVLKNILLRTVRKVLDEKGLEMEKSAAG